MDERTGCDMNTGVNKKNLAKKSYLSLNEMRAMYIMNF